MRVSHTIFFFFFLLSSIQIEESIDFIKIFDSLFLMYLHILGCFEHDDTIFVKCLSVFACRCVRERDKNFVSSVNGELNQRMS